MALVEMRLYPKIRFFQSRAPRQKKKKNRCMDILTLEILEYCDSKYVISREQYYIDLLKPKYNILKIAGSSLGYKHSEETRAKISVAGKGKTLSELTKAKMSDSQKAVNRSGKITVR